MKSKDIQAFINRMQGDLEARLAGYRAKIAEAQKVVNGGGALEVARLEKEMGSLKATYQRTFDRKAAELGDAQDAEKQQASNAALLRQIHDDQIRATALAAWQKHGGRPEEFTDELYASLRQTQLTAATLKDLQAKDAKPNPVHL